MGRVARFKKIKSIDPFYKGKRKSTADEHDDPPNWNVLRAKSKERRAQQLEAAEAKRKNRVEEEDRELKLIKGLSRKERKEVSCHSVGGSTRALLTLKFIQRKITDNRLQKKAKLSMGSVSTISSNLPAFFQLCVSVNHIHLWFSTTAMDKGEFVPLFEGIPNERTPKPKNKQKKKKKSKRANQSDDNEPRNVSSKSNNADDDYARTTFFCLMLATCIYVLFYNTNQHWLHRISR
jgi:hypothetical protein